MKKKNILLLCLCLFCLHVAAQEKRTAKIACVAKEHRTLTGNEAPVIDTAQPFPGRKS